MKEKIKVVFAINDFSVGGAQRLLLELYKSFNTEKFDWHLITLLQFPDKWDYYDLLPEYIKVKKINFKSIKDLKSFYSLYKYLKVEKPDIVISNLFFANTVFRILKVLLGYKVIVIKHNTNIYKGRAQTLIDILLNFVTTKIVAEAKTVKNFVMKKEKIKEKKIVIIPCVVNIEDTDRAKKNFDKNKILDELNFTEKNKIIINVARLTHQKNHKLLIDIIR